ncbi:hypothetical protein SEVIR_7G105950v4 [Setaria viridis]
MDAEGYWRTAGAGRASGRVRRIRRLYLQAMLRQEPGFSDSGDGAASEVISGISKDASVIQEVLAVKVHRPTTPSTPASMIDLCFVQHDNVRSVPVTSNV